MSLRKILARIRYGAAWKRAHAEWVAACRAYEAVKARRDRRGQNAALKVVKAKATRCAELEVAMSGLKARAAR